MLLEYDDHDLVELLKAYDRCFVGRDTPSLRSFYPDRNDELIYLDNHAGNDAFSVSAHMNTLMTLF
ncbi:MAG TPA: hypothetical protein PKK43_12575 [Spirochaetota bacterium]|nr:hypothetical protein [Spirochaetota bacterium]